MVEPPTSYERFGRRKNDTFVTSKAVAEPWNRLSRSMLTMSEFCNGRVKSALAFSRQQEDVIRPERLAGIPDGNSTGCRLTNGTELPGLLLWTANRSVRTNRQRTAERTS